MTQQPVAVARRPRRLATAAVGVVLVALFLIISAVIYDAVIESDGISLFDRPTLMQMISLRTPVADSVITGFTNLGGQIGMTIITLLVAALMLWRSRSATPVIVIAIAVAGSLLLTHVGKAVIGRARPPLADAVPPYEGGFSLPSGHALNSTVIAGVVAYLIVVRCSGLVIRLIAILGAALWASTMGLSRLFLGQHWFTDVAFAWALGLAWLIAVITGHRLLGRHERSRWTSRPTPAPAGHDPTPSDNPPDVGSETRPTASP